MFKFFRDVPPRGEYSFKLNEDTIVTLELIGVINNYQKWIDDDEFLLVMDKLTREYSLVSFTTWDWMKHCIQEPYVEYEDIWPGTYFKCTDHIFHASLYRKENMDDGYSYYKDGQWHSDDTFTPKGKVLMVMEHN